MKKVFIFINSLDRGGAERVVQTISNYLIDKQKINIVLVTMDSGIDAYDIHPRVKRYRLKLGLLSRSLGKILFLPFQAWEFSRIVKNENPDVVISFLVRANLAHVFSRFLGNNRPIFISERSTMHDLYVKSGLKGRLMLRFMRWLYPKADRVLAISEGVKNSLEVLGVASNKIKVIYNPQDLELIKKQASERVALNLGSKRFIIVTSGRLVDQKDHVTLLEAFSIVRREVEAILVLIGDGPKREELEKKARSLGIYSSVIFLGWQNNPFAIMKRCDLFVLSSKIEGFGNVLVEAMSCGLPVISTDVSGPREILMDGKAGVLVPIGESQILGKAMLKMLTNDTFRNNYIEKSLKRAKDFDVKVIITDYLEFLGIK